MTISTGLANRSWRMRRDGIIYDHRLNISDRLGAELILVCCGSAGQYSDGKDTEQDLVCAAAQTLPGPFNEIKESPKRGRHQPPLG
jgi:hypothetical protein